jgi:hypothetical protein
MNPALTSFLAVFDAETLLGQVLIRRIPGGFELRHVADRDAGDDTLEVVSVSELRALAQFTGVGAFRPLKSAPNLRRGWRLVVPDESALEMALNHLYPGAVADWFAARSSSPPVTGFREFTSRQTGMYRITTMLTDNIAAAAIRACCAAEFCLKRRLWSVERLSPDEPDGKSVIPCLEPCAVLLEFARKVARLEQDENATDAPPVEPDATVAETDFDAPGNPRRVRFLREKQSVAIRGPLD